MAGGTTATTSSSQPAASRSAFSFLQCSTCRRDFYSDPPTPFFVTACAHSLCSSCLFPPPAHPPSTHEELAQLFLPCGYCSTSTHLTYIDASDGGVNMPEPLRTCFRPLRELIEGVGMAAEYQLASLVEQNSWFREKVIAQRQVLNKLSIELTALRQLKLKADELEGENHALRDENAALRQQLSNFGGASDNTVQDIHGFGAQRYSTSDGGASYASKRRAQSPLPPRSYASSPSQAQAPMSLPAFNRPPSQNQSSHPPGSLQPTRLSLSPSHSAKAVGASQMQPNNHYQATSHHQSRPPSADIQHTMSRNGQPLSRPSSAISQSRNQQSNGFLNLNADLAYVQQDNLAPPPPSSHQRRPPSSSANQQRLTGSSGLGSGTGSRRAIAPMPIPGREGSMTPQGTPRLGNQQLSLQHQYSHRQPFLPQQHLQQQAMQQYDTGQLPSRAAAGTPKPNLSQFRFRG